MAAPLDKAFRKPDPMPHDSRLFLLRIGGTAFSINLKTLRLTMIAGSSLMALLVWGLTLGSFPLSLGEVYGGVTGSGTEDALFIVRELRLPRALTAVIVGGMLAMSGAIFQGLVRNPLVSPDIIGINSGAAVAAVFWIVTGLPLAHLPLVAFVGALAAAAVVYLLSWRGRMSPSRLVLVGIGVNAALTAGTTFLIVRAEINDASRAVLWLTGSVYSANWSDVIVLSAAMTILVPASLSMTWHLRLFQAGDITARSVGAPLERTRLALIVVACGLSSLTVAVAGPIGFVALMTPHLARMMAGPISGGVLLLAGVLGAMLTLSADMAGQHALPVNLPVGVLTAAVGAPYFLFLLYRTNTRL